MPLPELIKPLAELGLPVTEGRHETWRHSRFYLRARTSGVRAAIALARSEDFPMNAEALKRYDRQPAKPAEFSVFALDALTPAERRALEEQLAEATE